MGKEIEAILIDVDGCLVSTSGDVSLEYHLGLNKITEYVKRANRGEFPSIGFCSGRDRNYIEAVAFCLGLPNSWSVIESGIAIFNPTTKEMFFNPALTPDIKKMFEEISRERIPRILERYPDLFLYPGNMINVALERKYRSKISIEAAYEVIKIELRDLLEVEAIVIHHSDIAIDISPKGIDKSSGTQFLARHNNMDLTKTLGIGDSNGDFPMLHLVAYHGCPANASKECKKLIEGKKGYLSPYPYARGVADIISHFVGE